MAREFVDSFTPKSTTELSLCLQVALKLGFSEIWISNPTKEEKKLFLNSSHNSSLRIYERLDIGEQQESKDQIMTILRKKRRSVPIISITCLNPEITAWAAQDNRIDILRFPIFQTKLMTRSIAKLMLKFTKYLEIPLSELYNLPEHQQIPAIRQIRAALTVAKQKKVQIIFTSNSTVVEDIRTPRDLAALGETLLDASSLTLDPVSNIPIHLMQENLIKISRDYIMPGVYQRNMTNSFQNIREEEE